MPPEAGGAPDLRSRGKKRNAEMCNSPAGATASDDATARFR
jgi:hypothetical protein